MNTTDLKKNSKEELIIYIEKMSRDMSMILEENLKLRKNYQYLEEYMQKLKIENENLLSNINIYINKFGQIN